MPNAKSGCCFAMRRPRGAPPRVLCDACGHSDGDHVTDAFLSELCRWRTEPERVPGVTRGPASIDSPPASPAALSPTASRLLETITWLDDYAATVGLYRIEAKGEEVSAMTVSILSSPVPALGTDPFAVACAFKRILRYHAPLFPYDTFDSVLACKDAAQLGVVLQGVPAGNRALLAALARHLHRVCSVCVTVLVNASSCACARVYVYCVCADCEHARHGVDAPRPRGVLQ